MERKFGHCVANWTIENSHMLPMKLPFQILSPEIYVRGFKTTKWILKLKNKEINDKFELYFELDNLNSDDKNLNFSGQCNVKFSEKIRKEMNLREFTLIFSSNERCLTQRIEPFHNCDILLLKDIYIQCSLFIVFVDVLENIATCREVALKELSGDLLRLYKSKRYSDVVLKVDSDASHNIDIHRAIIRCRNTMLKKYLDLNTGEVTVDHYGRIDEWRNIVKFLYTADMKHVLDPPKISYYDISVLYNIEPIISFFQPEEINLYSIVPLEEFDITYTIPKFLTCDDNYIETLQLIIGSNDINIKISVYPRSLLNESDDSCVCITVSGQIPSTILIELNARNIHRKKLLNRLCGQIANDKTYEEHSFHEREILNHYLKDGNLILVFNLQMMNLNLINQYKRYSIPIMKCKPCSEEYNFRTLSRDMMKFYYESNHQKVKFIIGDEKYFAHACILFVRANSLLNLINRNNSKVVKKERAKKWVVIHLIYFLYTGKYNSPFHLKDVLALYDIANFLKMESLKRILERTIEENIHTFRIEDLVKIFYFIDSERIPYLMQRARNVLHESTLKKFI